MTRSTAESTSALRDKAMLVSSKALTADRLMSAALWRHPMLFVNMSTTSPLNDNNHSGV
jgi:hypothetical protein